MEPAIRASLRHSTAELREEPLIPDRWSYPVRCSSLLKTPPTISSKPPCPPRDSRSPRNIRQLPSNHPEPPVPAEGRAVAKKYAPARVELDALPGRSLSGKISEVEAGVDAT